MCGADVVRALFWVFRVGDANHLDDCRMLEEKGLAQASIIASSVVRRKWYVDGIRVLK